MKKGSSPPLFLKYSVSFHMRGIRRSVMTKDMRLGHKNVNLPPCSCDVCLLLFWLCYILHWLAWDGHFSFAWQPIVHRPCVWRPARDLLHDLSFLHPLQLRHVGHDASAAGLQALGRLQRLVFLGAGGQQFAGPVTHADLMVNLLLDVAVLQGRRMTERRSVNVLITLHMSGS